MEVTSYTRGHGRLTCALKGYEPCHNEEEVLEAFHYDSEADMRILQALYFVRMERVSW